jgi:hypothetical protein
MRVNPHTGRSRAHDDAHAPPAACNVSRLTEKVPLRSSLQKNRLKLHMHAPNMSKRQYREDAPCSARVCHPAPEIKCTSLQPDGSFKEFKLSDHKGR